MDRGVINNHKGQITCTPPVHQKDDKGNLLYEDEDKKVPVLNTFPDVVLRPGKNRLTGEQYAAIKTNKVVQKYFDIGLLRSVKIPEAAGASDFRDAKSTGDPDEVDALPNLKKLSKAALIKLGKNKFKLDLSDQDTVEVLRDQIVQAAKNTPKG